MRRRSFIAASGAALFFGRPARADSRPPRIAFIAPGPASNPSSIRQRDTFLAELAKCGWPQSAIDFRAYYATGAVVDFAASVREAISGEPDVIVAISGSTLAALKGEKRIPIVFDQVTDPLSQGFVESLAHPGGNITGFSYFDASLGGKWLALLKQLVPTLSRVACLFNPDTAASANFYLRVLAQAGTAVGVTVEAAPVHGNEDIAAALQGAAARGAGFMELPDGFLGGRASILVAEMLRNRVPGFFFLVSQVPQGGLISYAVDEVQQAANAADYVDRILRGERPADLPVQSPTKFTLAINLKTARALGVTVPTGLIAAADQVIE